MPASPPASHVAFAFTLLTSAAGLAAQGLSDDQRAAIDQIGEPWNQRDSPVSRLPSRAAGS